MSSNVHGHKLPEPFRTNPDNPIFQRHEPEVAQPEIPQGLHGAPALRSELELPAEVPSPAGLPTAADLDAVAQEQAAQEAIAGATVDPTDCSAGQSSTQTGDTLSQESDTLTTAASQEAVTQSE